MEGINVNEKGNSGWTALMYASQSGHLGIVQELVKVEGISANETNDDGDTARDMAIEERDGSLDSNYAPHAERILRHSQIIALLTEAEEATV